MTQASDAEWDEVPANRRTLRVYRCRRCGSSGHNLTTCQASDADAQAFAAATRAHIQRQHTCSHCGRIGHNKRTCGHPAKPRLTPTERVAETQKRFQERHPGLLEQLGNVSDGKLAKAYGLSRQRVCQLRLREARRAQTTTPGANVGEPE